MNRRTRRIRVLEFQARTAATILALPESVTFEAQPMAGKSFAQINLMADDSAYRGSIARVAAAFAALLDTRIVKEAKRLEDRPKSRHGVQTPWSGRGGSPTPRNAPCPCGSGRKFKNCGRVGRCTPGVKT